MNLVHMYCLYCKHSYVALKESPCLLILLSMPFFEAALIVLYPSGGSYFPSSLQICTLTFIQGHTQKPLVTQQKHQGSIKGIQGNPWLFQTFYACKCENVVNLNYWMLPFWFFLFLF